MSDLPVDDELALEPATRDQGAGGSDGVANQPGGWRFEVRRWLVTLNPGRTPREYEKAVAYFFETPGVPPTIASVSQDLLLAYRGALAMRATPHAEVQSTARTRRDSVPAGARLGAPPEPNLIGESAAAHDAAPTPLAPATVNIRLTALRQFLCHCALFDVTTLPPDRIRAALKRIAIERRRPYQVLAEPEWESFLRIALQPRDQGQTGRSITRAERQQLQAAIESGDVSGPLERLKVRRSRAGLTGARTAERDHALLALALATGLRAIELASLDVGDITREWHAGQEEWWLVLPDAKTKGQRGGRTLPLGLPLVQVIFDYLSVSSRSWESPADRATPLFVSTGNPLPKRRSARSRPRAEEADAEQPPRGPHRLTPGAIRRIVDRVETQWLAERGSGGGRHGSRAISPHALRHSTAIALLEGNTTAGRPPASVEHVRGWLGHFDIRTTQGYLAHLEAREKKRPFKLDPVLVQTPREDVPKPRAEPESPSPRE